MRKSLIGLTVALLAVALTACSDAAADPGAEEMRQQSDYWQIDQIEKDFHTPRRSKTST
jgi:hypothetical protein